jgi:hypothetical protein
MTFQYIIEHERRPKNSLSALNVSGPAHQASTGHRNISET